MKRIHRRMMKLFTVIDSISPSPSIEYVLQSQIYPTLEGNTATASEMTFGNLSMFEPPETVTTAARAGEMTFGSITLTT